MIMKKLLTLAPIVFIVLAASAQSNNNGGLNQDSVKRGHHVWRGDRTDSSFRDRRAFRDHAVNRFGERNFRGRFDRSRQRDLAFSRGRNFHYTADQRRQMHAINQDYRKQQQDLYRQDNLTLREYKSRLLALQKDRNSKLQNLLTPEQKTAMANWKKRRSEDRQVRAAAQLERMKIRLKLSDEQVSKIQSQESDLHSQIAQIRQNDDLLPDQKRDQLKALFEKRDLAMKSVLTPEQYSQFEKFHHRHFGYEPVRSEMN